MLQIFNYKNVYFHNYLGHQCKDFQVPFASHVSIICDCLSSLCQIWWEQAVSTMAWSTAMGRASSPAVNTSVCVWTVPSAVCHCAQSHSLRGCGAKPHGGSKSKDSAVSNGYVMNPREGARPRRDTQWRVCTLDKQHTHREGEIYCVALKISFILQILLEPFFYFTIPNSSTKSPFQHTEMKRSSQLSQTSRGAKSKEMLQVL